MIQSSQQTSTISSLVSRCFQVSRQDTTKGNMGRKKRPQNNSNNQVSAPKKAKQDTGESFLVKKYRPDKIYQAMEAFVKYTKSHRMLDASYVRWNTGVTPEKPHVFSTRVGGVDLGWGRGKTREAAMDCACRAAFALVRAHGYNNFPLDDDCLTQPPVDLPPPPPPPPSPSVKRNSSALIIFRSWCRTCWFHQRCPPFWPRRIVECRDFSRRVMCVR